MSYLSRTWQVVYPSPAVFASGATYEGVAGGSTARALSGIVAVDPAHRLLRLTCGGQGRTVDISTDDTLRRYVYDCAAQGAGSGWQPLKAWLDQYFAVGDLSALSYRTFQNGPLKAVLRQVTGSVQVTLSGA